MNWSLFSFVKEKFTKEQVEGTCKYWFHFLYCCKLFKKCPNLMAFSSCLKWAICSSIFIHSWLIVVQQSIVKPFVCLTKMVMELYPRRNLGLFSGPWGKIPPPRNSMTSWKQLMLMVIRLKYRHQETASRYLELFPHLQNLNSCLVFFFQYNI